MGLRRQSVDRRGARVLGAFIDAVEWPTALARISDWATRRESRYVCICNVHSVVTATQDHEFQALLNAADMATPDGMPVAWMLRRLGYTGQERISGADLMWKYCDRVARGSESVFFIRQHRHDAEATVAKAKGDISGTADCGHMFATVSRTKRG